MPSVEYTQSKGLIQKSSDSATLDLQGELFGHRKSLPSLGNGSHQLTVADSGKEFLITGAGDVSILLPPAKGVKTDMEFTAGGAFTVGEEFLFDALGGKFRLEVVAEAGQVANGALISVTDGVARFALKDGAGGGAGLAGTNLHAVLTAQIGGVATLGAAGANFTITADAVGSSFNGTITKNDGTVAIEGANDVITNLTIDKLPVHGADAIADSKGTKLRFVVNADLAGTVTIAIPVNNAGTANGAFVGHVTRPGGVEAASADVMTLNNGRDSLGDYYELICDGPTTGNWYLSGFALNAAASVGFA